MDGSVDITVEGGYQPDVISVPKGKTTKINFFRKDPSSCLEEVVLSDFKIKKYKNGYYNDRHSGKYRKDHTIFRHKILF